MNNKILPTQAKILAADILEEVQTYIKQKHYYQALEGIDELLELNQFDNDLIYQKAELHARVGEFDKAYHWLKAFADNQGPDARSFVLNAEIQLKLGHKEETVKILGDFFKALEHRYVGLDNESIYERLDNIIAKLKKSYKWSKLLRLCPELKDYDHKRRKALKQIAINKEKAEAKQKTAAASVPAAVEEELIVAPTEELTEEGTRELAPVQPRNLANIPAKNLATTPAKELATTPAKTLATTPKKELAANPAKHIAVPPAKDMQNPPLKEIMTPMEKLLAEQKEKSPEPEDEYRKMTYEEIYALIKELWDKGRLGAKQQRMLARQEVNVIQKAIEQQVLSLRKKIWLYNYVANIFRQRVLFDEAIFLLRSALNYDDEDPTLLKNLGYTLLASGDSSVAKKVLEDARLGDIHRQNLDYTVIDLLAQCPK